MDGLQCKNQLKGMIWGYPHLWKPPYIVLILNLFEPSVVTFSNHCTTISIPRNFQDTTLLLKLQVVIKPSFCQLHAHSANLAREKKHQILPFCELLLATKTILGTTPCCHSLAQTTCHGSALCRNTPHHCSESLYFTSFHHH